MRDLIESIRQMAEEGGQVPVPNPILVEMARAWLALDAAPVGRIDFHCDNMDGVEMCEFSPHGTRSRAKKLDGTTVRLVHTHAAGGE